VSHTTLHLDAVVDSDPRISHDSLRWIDRDGPPVLLVGVVHDHPASEYRVSALVEAVAPETVALELPEFVVSAAGGGGASSAVGGEMAAAIEAAGSRPVVGIDVPGRRTGSAFVAELRARRPAARTILRTGQSIARMTAHAVASRLTQSGIPGASSIATLDRSQKYDLPADASPSAQADHEAAHRHRSTTLLRAFEPPPATSVLDAVRERYMAERIESIRRDGPVVAIVGCGHLDGLETRLRKDRTG
jgi:pheromone shutdown protein TraB